MVTAPTTPSNDNVMPTGPSPNPWNVASTEVPLQNSPAQGSWKVGPTTAEQGSGRVGNENANQGAGLGASETPVKKQEVSGITGWNMNAPEHTNQDPAKAGAFAPGGTGWSSTLKESLPSAELCRDRSASREPVQSPVTGSGWPAPKQEPGYAAFRQDRSKSREPSKSPAPVGGDAWPAPKQAVPPLQGGFERGRSPAGARQEASGHGWNAQSSAVPPATSGSGWNSQPRADTAGGWKAQDIAEIPAPVSAGWNQESSRRRDENAGEYRRENQVGGWQQGGDRDRGGFEQHDRFGEEGRFEGRGRRDFNRNRSQEGGGYGECRDNLYGQVGGFERRGDRPPRGGFGRDDTGGREDRYGSVGPGYGGGETNEPPARVRDSDSVPVENRWQTMRSDEFTAERNADMEKALFAQRTAKGINFAKYNKIKSSVTGENVPPPIETFEQCGFHPHILENIQFCKYEVPTPVQKASIPILMAGRDFMAAAQTGSGKTAAFLAPILSRALQDPSLMAGSRSKRGSRTATPFCLIMAPTRELSCQIFDECRKFAYRTGIRPCVIYGGQPAFPQLDDLTRGCDILIGTPGRIFDFVERGRLSFHDLRFFVLDEADRMLDMGFESQMKQIVGHPNFPDKDRRETFMFSATFPRAIQELAAKFLRPEYLFVGVGSVGGACENIQQEIIEVEGYHKREALVDLLNAGGRQRVLIFVSSKRMADQLDDFLFQKGFPCTSIHGDRNQLQRESALESFKIGKTPILVATDVASRGLDIPEVHHVVIFDMPQNIEDYVHRIGRTGRAGNVGKSTTFFGIRDKALSSALVKVLQDAGQPVPDFLKEYTGNDLFANRHGNGNNVEGVCNPSFGVDMRTRGGNKW